MSSDIASLAQAIREDNVNKVVAALQSSDPNTININNGSLVAYTASCGSYKTMQYLIQHKKISVDRVGPDGRHAANNAARNGHEDIIQQLVSNNADIDYIDSSGDPPLIAALKKDYKDVAACLILVGANVNQTGKDGKTPIAYAIRQATKDGDISIIQLLLENSDVNIQCALLEAIAENNFDLVQYLFNQGAKVNDIVNGCVPLVEAVEVENLDIVKFLVEKGADVKQMDERKRTPVSVAAAKHNFEIFRYLVKASPDLEKMISEMEKNEELRIGFKIYLNALQSARNQITEVEPSHVSSVAQRTHNEETSYSCFQRFLCFFCRM